MWGSGPGSGLTWSWESNVNEAVALQGARKLLAGTVEVGLPMPAATIWAIAEFIRASVETLPAVQPALMAWRTRVETPPPPPPLGDGDGVGDAVSLGDAAGFGDAVGVGVVPQQSWETPDTYVVPCRGSCTKQEGTILRH